MRRATLIVAIAVMLLSFVPFVSTALQAVLLALAALAMTTVAFRDYGRVGAVATLVALTSSAVVLLGGLTAARPAAGSLPTAGVLWWWPLAVGGLLTARLSIAAFTDSHAHATWRGPAFLASLAATVAWQAWSVRGITIDARIVVPLVMTGTFLLFVDAISDDDVTSRAEAAPPAVHAA